MATLRMVSIGLFVSLLLTVSVNHAAKILVIPVYHYSHVNLMGSAGAALSSSGHDVTMLVSSMFSKVPEKLKLKSLLYEISKDDQLQDKVNLMIDHEKNITLLYRAVTEVLPLFGKVCEQVLGDEQLMDKIVSEKYDLVLMDSIPVVQCLYTIPYKFNIPYMSINVMLDPWSAGVPASAAFEPVQVIEGTNKMSFFQRFLTAGIYTLVHNIPELTLSSDYYVRKYAPNKPVVTIHQLYRNSAMFLVNHEITCMDFPRVSAPNYQFIGGSSAKPAQPLPADIADFVNDATAGVVVISFGSLAAWQKMWRSLKPLVIHAFKQMPQKAVILYTLDDYIQDFPDNIKVQKWLPQNDLLGHPNTKLFITHGGNNGQLEAAYHGVPSLVVPITGDQIYNGIKVESHQYGKMIKAWDQITTEVFLDTLHQLLSNSTYFENIQKCSRIIRSQPSTQERVVYWVNHILEFGGAHLRPPSIDLPLYQVLMVDIILFAVFLVIVISATCVSCCWCLVKRCCLRGGKNKQKTA